MKTEIATAVALSAARALAYIQGFDISNYQPNVDFAGAKAAGAQFVFIKATEGTSYIDPTFSKHYTAATKAGLIRGAYHFAHPGETSGATQAAYLLAHGGGWSGDGITLPAALDLESEGSSGECWGLTPAQMVAWIKDFSDTYHAKTTRYPILYFNPSWWKTCTGNSNAFSTTNPLWLAAWSSTPGTIPGGWPFETFWQYADTYDFGGDADRFNGDAAGLTKMATG